MLTSIREKTQGIIAGFIVLLIVIPFALWGINSYFETGSNIAVAKVNGIEITQRAYRSAMDQMRNQVRAGALDDPQFKQWVVQGLIDQALQVQQADEQGYRISDSRLSHLIREAPSFQRNGRFDPQTYEALLRREGLSPHEFEARLRRDSLTQQLRNGFNESVIVTETEIAAILRLQRQQREIAYAVVGLQPLMSKIRPSQKEVEEYYSSHAQAFKTKEQVHIEYIRLAAADLMRDYKPSEEELRQLYAEEAGRYITPGERRASHILITLNDSATPEETKKVLAQIKEIETKLGKGADFAQLAKKYSQDPESAGKGGDLGKITRGILPKELEAVVFKLNNGEISPPVRTGFGYHLVKLTQLKPDKRKSFNEVRAELVKLIHKRRGEERFYESTEKFQNLIYEQPDSLAPAAKALGLKIEQSEWVSRDGGKAILANPKVLEAAFSPEVLEEKRNSGAIEFDPETLVAIRVIGHRPAAARPLDQVQHQIEALLKQERAKAEAEVLIEGLLKQLREGAQFAALAKKYNLEYHKPQTTTRQSTSMEQHVVDAAFQAKRPENNQAVYGAVDLGRRGGAIYALTRAHEGGDVKPGGPEWESVRQLLSTRRGAEYFSNYRTGLRKNAKIKIFPDQL